MRGRAAVLLSLLTLFAVPALPDCNYSLLYSGQFRASYLDLAIEGNDLWAATSYGVSLFNRLTDPPALVATIAVPGVTRAVRVIGGTAFAASGTRVYVLRRNGNSLSIAGSYDAGATVNDLVATALNLYVATTSGLQQVDALTLQKTAATLTTSSTNVTSLSLAPDGATLYAADGDSSIEVFNISISTLPQHTGTIASLPRVISVEATPTRLYASDGFSTDVFFTNGGGSTHAATATGGTLALATLKDEVIFTAGSDRRIRAIDWTTSGSPVDLFSTDIIPNGGTINRVGAMQIAGGRLYVAAGDAGLLTYDVSAFAAPFAVRSYPTGAVTSTAWVDGKLYASRSAAGISEFVKSPSTGYLTAARHWDARVHTVWGGSNGFLLTSSGKTLFYWTLASTTPTLVTSATLNSNIASAALFGHTAYVALDDKSVWTADLSALAPAPVALPYQADSLQASSTGVAYALSSAASGTTRIGYLTTGDALPPPVSVGGISTVPVAAATNTAAIFTFTGINVLGPDGPYVLPNSSSPIARRLAFSGTRLLELTDTSLIMWNLTTRKAIRTFALPTEGSSLAVDALAALATSNGVETIAIDGLQSSPTLLATRNGNLYYRKVAVSPDRLYLGTTSSVDMYETTYGTAPHHLMSFRVAGLLDFTSTANGFATLSNANVVTAYSREGGVLAQRALDVNSGTQPLSINSAGNAVWVSISRGCTTGGCEKKTLVLDPQTLVQTATVDGGAADVTTSGTRAFAIFDLPAEVRTYDIAAPLAPAQLARVAAPGTRTPASIAFANNTVYVAGDKLYAYDPLLAQRTDNLDAFQTDPTGATTFNDQRIRTETTCAFFSRGLQPQWLSVPQLTAKNATSSAVVRSIAQTPGRFWILTDDAIELWSTGGTNPPPPKRRAAGR
jgi:hypothetical protein